MLINIGTSLSAGFIKSEKELNEAEQALYESRSKWGFRSTGAGFFTPMGTAYYLLLDHPPASWLVPFLGLTIAGIYGGAYIGHKGAEYYFKMQYPYPDAETFARNFPDHSYPCSRHTGKELNIQTHMKIYAKESFSTLGFYDDNCIAPNNPYVKNAQRDCGDCMVTLSKYIALHRLGVITFEKPGNGFHLYDARCMQQDSSEISKLYGNPDGPRFYLPSAEPKIVSEFRQHYDFSAEIKGGETDGRELRLKYE